ncbi:hypothetical protein GLYMA_10G088200v4 [Glycine max]|nr:hypothetical protein GLYMA_10G088200v4 [Glycine max]KAH1137413.1 hypothetical protein GYH30_027417 [Glycine max]
MCSERFMIFLQMLYQGLLLAAVMKRTSIFSTCRSNINASLLTCS